MQDSRTFFLNNTMSPPRNPGAANFNRLMNLHRRLNQAVENHNLHNLRSKNTLQEYRATTIALRRAGTNERRRFFQRQLNRMQPGVNRVYANRRRLMTQRNNIRRQIATILGHTREHLNIMNEMRHNNTLAGIRRMQGTRLAQMIEKAYLRPGGMYTKKMMKQI